jgi:competence protein ComEA
MADLTPRQLVLWVAGAAVVVLLGLHALRREGAGGGGGAPVPIRLAGDGGAGSDPGSAGSGSRIVVHVAGAVRRPGVYRLPAGARVEQAVRRAGGATRRADLGGLNLAAKAEDGRQVLVPRRTPVGAPATSAGGAGGAGTGPPAAPLNLNTATVAQLDELSGVGPATAQKIIDYREQHDGFGSVEELGQVPGIGDVRLAALRDLVTV